MLQEIASNDLNNLQFELYSNIDASGMSEEELLEISFQRAKTVERKLLGAGILESNIFIHSQADEAPLYSDNEELNNRVDIIIRKMKKVVVDLNVSVEKKIQEVEEEAPVPMSMWVGGVNTEADLSDMALEEELPSITPVAITETEDKAEVITGPVINVGTFNVKAAAIEFSKKFDNMIESVSVVEFSSNHYNVKLVVINEEEVSKALEEARKIVKDAWYTGIQSVTIVK